MQSQKSNSLKKFFSLTLINKLKFQIMSYNLTSVTELKDIPESDMEKLSQSQSVKSDSDPDYVPPSSSSADELSASGQSDNSQVINLEWIDIPENCKEKQLRLFII